MSTLPITDRFERRHIGPNSDEVQSMLKTLGLKSLDELVQKTVPAGIRLKKSLQLEAPLSEYEALASMHQIAVQNQVWRSFIGMGYYDTITPPVILRNILENPGWYTQYTPYQAEISQGRLEALLNFQTMISDLTALPIANASLLDEATAAAEAMSLSLNVQTKPQSHTFFVSEKCHPQTIEVVKTRAKPMGIDVLVGDHRSFKFEKPVFGVMVQYPDTEGTVSDLESFVADAHKNKAMVVVAADLLALTVLKAPGEFGADVVIGSTQRFGVPLGFGGPHAAYMSTKDEYKRQMPGRLIGVSIDADGRPALRLALQTREQHIRRAKATSNICTAQVLLAVTASMYAIYHGPKGLRDIATRVNGLANQLAAGLEGYGFKLLSKNFFDTVTVSVTDAQKKDIQARAAQLRINLNTHIKGALSVSVDEATFDTDIKKLLSAFSGKSLGEIQVKEVAPGQSLPAALKRKSEYLTHPVFNKYHSETEMLRYMTMLQSRDLSLTSSMIPLGSCTMKLNATAEMIPITWAEFGRIHPFVPSEQVKGYQALITGLEKDLAEITGFDGVSMQPNAGSQGEYAGLLVIRKFHEVRGQGQRNVCLIPASAHGTNPASAAMCGMEIIGVNCDSHGNIDVADLKAKAELHKDKLAALMVTYPSTHGVFEEAITEICDVIHKFGGQVYMDGANMNAQVGLCRPADIGADVCHLNLHKTFCIPHGGGGPGMGPICVKKHLVPHLPGHGVTAHGSEKSVSAVSAAPYGSPSILPISYAYIRMMGADGLKRATEVAILNANYIAKRLDAHYPVLYKGKEGMVAHECILDVRPIKAATGIDVTDVAKRLMDYGFHAPTISFPVPGTIMIEPTESESKAELDRFCEAMIMIRDEIREVEAGKADGENNVLKRAPHTAHLLAQDAWDRPYSRMKAVFPAPWLKQFKFWPAVSRINDPYGDRNLMCSCPPVEAYGEAQH